MINNGVRYSVLKKAGKKQINTKTDTTNQNGMFLYINLK